MLSRILLLVLLPVLAAPMMVQAQECATCHDKGSHVRGVHRQGVGNCNMCHTMHNLQDGALVDPDHPGGNEFLLVSETPSDVCLNCHAGLMGNVFGDDPVSPPAEVGGGNFTFLLEDNINDGPGGVSSPIPGDRAGHSILAPSRGVFPDGTHLTSPGGNFPAMSLGCTSCHDPHGNTNFRMLNSVGSVQDHLFNFAAPAPEGYGLSIYHGRERADRHTAYFKGFSEWCGNCHGDFHTSNGKFIHESGAPIGATVAATYNMYNGTADPLGGEAVTAYLPAVPVEDPSLAYTNTQGPSANSRLMCLTCHRAHATSAPSAGRWDMNVTFLADDGVVSGSYAIPNPYGDAGQRSLCNKCHAKDEFSNVP